MNLLLVCMLVAVGFTQGKTLELEERERELLRVLLEDMTGRAQNSDKATNIISAGTDSGELSSLGDNEVTSGDSSEVDGSGSDTTGMPYDTTVVPSGGQSGNETTVMPSGAESGNDTTVMPSGDGSEESTENTTSESDGSGEFEEVKPTNATESEEVMPTNTTASVEEVKPLVTPGPAASTILYPGIGLSIPPLIKEKFAGPLENHTELTTAEAFTFFNETRQLMQEVLQEFSYLHSQLRNPGVITEKTFHVAIKHFVQLFAIAEAELAPEITHAIEENTYMGARAVIAGTDEVDPATGEQLEEPCRDNLVCSINKVALLVRVTDQLIGGASRYMSEWNYVLPCDMLTNTLETSAVNGDMNIWETLGALTATLTCRIHNMNAIVYGLDPISATESPGAWLPELIVPMGMWSHVQLTLVQREILAFKETVYFLYYVNKAEGYEKREQYRDMSTDNQDQEVKRLMERSFNKNAKQFVRREV